MRFNYITLIHRVNGRNTCKSVSGLLNIQIVEFSHTQAMRRYIPREGIFPQFVVKISNKSLFTLTNAIAHALLGPLAVHVSQCISMGILLIKFLFHIY